MYNDYDDDYVSPDHDESNWLVSYADMMTLLCGFFVMLFSFSTLDQVKYEKAAEKIAQKFGGKVTASAELLVKNLKKNIEEKGLQKEFSVQLDDEGVLIVFESTLFFDTSRAGILETAKIKLATLAKLIFEILQKEKRSFKVVVEGHSDSRPIATTCFVSNWELSAARAAAVVRFLISYGFSPLLISAIGYADTHPLVKDKDAQGGYNESALAKNRRVVLRLISYGASKEISEKKSQ